MKIYYCVWCLRDYCLRCAGEHRVKLDSGVEIVSSYGCKPCMAEKALTE